MCALLLLNCLCVCYGFYSPIPQWFFDFCPSDQRVDQRFMRKQFPASYSPTPFIYFYKWETSDQEFWPTLLGVSEIIDNLTQGPDSAGYVSLTRKIMSTLYIASSTWLLNITLPAAVGTELSFPLLLYCTSLRANLIGNVRGTPRSLPKTHTAHDARENVYFFFF